MADGTMFKDGYACLADINLPSEVLAVLPNDSYLQLELAYKITCHAYGQQVARLESENQQMQLTIGQNQQVIKSLERRVASMEADVHEHQQRARQCLSDQHKLVAEKNALIETVKRLNREVAKLEHFKRNLLQQLQDDDETEGPGGFAPSLAAVDLTTERLVTEVLQSADGIAAAAAAAAAAAVGQGQQQGQQQQQLGHGQLQQQQQPLPPLQQHHSYPRPARLSPPKSQPGALTAGLGASGFLGSPGSPTSNPYSKSHHPVIKAAAAGPGGGRGAAASAPSSPYAQQQRPSPPSPPRHTAGMAYGAGSSSGGGGNYAGRIAAGTPGNKGAAGGAGRGGDGGAAAAGGGAGGAAGSMSSPRIDGKEFFRQARARLSYEQFSQFLVAIKELNAGRSSREDTLAAARQLFGSANDDLYGLFEGLLMRHLTTL